MGISFTSKRFCTPKANFIEPAICLNFSTSISENESKSTKKHISSDIKSANVPSHAGKPGGGHLHCCSSSIVGSATLYQHQEYVYLR
ncbi:Uncharacterised protein [Vibrio cholerae]|nr:Uncharacterised protein [Vibrio cholerae]